MNNNFSVRLQELRKKKSLTQKQLADLIGVTDKAVSKWENDGGMPEITILPSLAKVLNVTTDYLLTGTDNTKPLSNQELCAKNDDLELYNELKKRNLFIKDETQKDLWNYVKQYNAVNVAMQIFEDGNLLKFIRPKDYQRYHYASLTEIPEIIINAAHSNQNYSIYTAFQIHRKRISNLPLEELIDRGFDNKKFNNNLFEWLLEKKDNYYWTNGISRLVEVLVNKKEQDKLNIVLDFCIQNNKKVFNEQEEIKRQTHEQPYFNSDTFDMVIYNRRKIGQYFVIPKTAIKSALKNDMIPEVLKMNEVNEHLIGKKGYVVSDFEFYKDKLEKDNELTNDQKKLKEITYNDIVIIDELIDLDNPKLYKEYIELPASVLEKGFLLIEKEKFKELLELAVEIGYKDVVRKIDTFDKIELRKVWVNDFKKEYKKHSFSNNYKLGSRDLLLSKEDKNHSYFVLEPTSVLYQSSTKIYEWLKECKYKITFKKIINHKNIFFFKKAIEYDHANINWALENVEPDRFDIIKLLLDNGAQLLKRWDDEDGIQHAEIDKIGTEILRKRTNEIVRENNE